MARTAAIEVAEHRIRINCIQPGWTDTPGELKFASRETLDTAGAKIPLGRLGTPEEMADLHKLVENADMPEKRKEDLHKLFMLLGMVGAMGKPKAIKN